MHPFRWFSILACLFLAAPLAAPAQTSVVRVRITNYDNTVPFDQTFAPGSAITISANPATRLINVFSEGPSIVSYGSLTVNGLTDREFYVLFGDGPFPIRDL